MNEQDGPELLRLVLPPAPEKEAGKPVKAWEEPVAMRTYLPQAPDHNPMFLEKRVYQGSSGRVYPLPFIDRIETEPRVCSWQAVHLENEFIRLMVLPEIGGRIQVGLDKTNGYDFFYRQNVIKPALVGLGGPWISGGVEFNWPQHHRPATFLPTRVAIEHSADGSVTVWCSDYDQMSGMKGMHGICLHPRKALLELKVRLYNATPFTQTFLWWANAAVRVHEGYQSFFPPDVQYVADHAKRAVSTFPHCSGTYYGVNYAERALSAVPVEQRPRQFPPDGSYAADDLSWYANIPVPTSYMVVGSKQDFFGGYDHHRRAGVVHVANHHIAPGKKQWTWGNHEFGYAWDRSLTEEDGPYIELMAGVYTDNQPDFSFLAPGETRTFSQYWYPLREIGPPQAATTEAALRLAVSGQRATVGVSATSDFKDAELKIETGDAVLARWQGLLAVAEPWMRECTLPQGTAEHDLTVTLRANGRVLVNYHPQRQGPIEPPETATEPTLPEAVETIEELYLTGLHLEQYRHATRDPTTYWRHALTRDPMDSRSNNALGRWHLRRGEFSDAQSCFDHAIRRLTGRNPNPYDGEPHYNLGLTLRYRGDWEGAYDAFYKVTWNAAWRAPAYFALAEISASNGDWDTSAAHLALCLRMDADHLHARNLKTIVLRKLGHAAEAETLLAETRSIDLLDIGSRYLATGELPSDSEQCRQLALDYVNAGLLQDAQQILERGEQAALTLYTLAWVRRRRGDETGAQAAAESARSARLDFYFPHRLEDILMLESAISADPQDPRAPYLLGNLLYDKRRYQEAMAHWEQAAVLDPGFATVWRNLGLAYYNVAQDPARARAAYDRAWTADPSDARVLFERDHLWKRLNVTAPERLAELQRYERVVSARDDLSVELAALFNQTGQPRRALELLSSRHFQPWEGGEGQAIVQYTRARLLLGKGALKQRKPQEAQDHFSAALVLPENLGEARHLLVNNAEIYYWLGVAFAETDAAVAKRLWERAAQSLGDFQQMSVRTVSDGTYWSALGLARLGRRKEADALFRAIEDYALQLEQQRGSIDYFATSLPAMLLFDEDLDRRNRLDALYLRAQTAAGSGGTENAEEMLLRLLAEESSHAGATDLLDELRTEALSTRRAR
jgi:tetratricopeptide (TPR) repeat protein